MDLILIYGFTQAEQLRCHLREPPALHPHVISAGQALGHHPMLVHVSPVARARLPLCRAWIIAVTSLVYQHLTTIWLGCLDPCPIGKYVAGGPLGAAASVCNDCEP